MVTVGYGPCPEGALPVYSVDTEEEARQLLTLACPRNLNEFVAPELVHEQTIENLGLFSDRLERAWQILQKRKGS